ncbi:hypothetical protein DAI22_11g207300 [Oryza sativa Japonica Group]|nr:hypothetical protein DAI22_11g207300 [Oryza sativa Japonica Group]
MQVTGKEEEIPPKLPRLPLTWPDWTLGRQRLGSCQLASQGHHHHQREQNKKEIQSSVQIQRISPPSLSLSRCSTCS